MNPQTGELAGVSGKGADRVSIEAVDKAIRKYEKKKDARCAETPGERDAKKELMAALHANLESLPRNAEGKRFYRYEVQDGKFKDYIIEDKLVMKVVDEEDAN